MSFSIQSSRFGNYELRVLEFRGEYRYEIWWHTGKALTAVGKGSEKYSDVYEARYSAVLHLASVLPRPHSERLIASQAELAWEPWP